MLIYVASPYGRRIKARHKQREKNVQDSIEAGRELILKGHTPFLPLLYHYVHKDWHKTLSEDRWHWLCVAWLAHCQAILRLPGKSWGADNEVEVGKAMGLKIFYDISEVPNESNPES